MLKQYQERVINQVRTYLQQLTQETGRYPSRDAWETLTPMLKLPLAYNRRVNGLGKDVPNFCLKVPTGGGKTLLATQVLGLIYDTILHDRNGAGLALWIVPSDQIYKDTLRALRDRNHFYRQSLEFAVKRSVEVWEKDEINRITPAQLTSELNILLLKFPGVNREERETLKIFRDSGGNIVQHFLPEDDEEAHRALREKFPNLEVIEGTELVKTSVGNLVRMNEPPVILDEGHKAYSHLAQNTLNGLNPTIIVELSATPKQQSNVLCKVTGKELLDEEMIKLPINIAAANLSDWRDCLDRARQKREELEQRARELYPRTERFIRPIVLVQVERTGKDQRDGVHVHSEDVKEHLIQKCGVPESDIAIKSSSTDDIEGIDLLDEGCPIKFIITKSALQEGWDCPFAYVLVSLNNVQSKQSMTQLVGRILRQPYQERTLIDALNESYVYCLHKSAKAIASEVKSALEKEGYEGDVTVRPSSPDGKDGETRTAGFRKEFESLYKDFDGKIYLPRFCVKGDDGKYAPLNYYTHLLRAVRVEAFPYDKVEWQLGDELEKAKEFFYRAQLGEELKKVGEQTTSLLDSDDAVRGWLLCNLDFDYFSHKQLRTVADSYLNALLARHPTLKGNLALVKYTLRDKVREFIEKQTDLQTEAAFKQLFDSKRLGFFMQCCQCRFKIPRTVEVRVTRRLNRASGDPLMKSLFDYVDESDFNEYEQAVALYLDEHPQILWWYRNLVGSDCFAIQGYKRERIFPDFIAASEGVNYSQAVYVVESKGAHLAGNPDTEYKESVASYFEQLGKAASWKELGKEFKDHVFRFQVLDEGKYEHNWKERLNELLTNGK